MCYGVGLALSVRNYFSSNLGAFGAVMGAYGVGNLAAAIWFGNRERKNPEPLVYLGFIVIGVGFIWIGLSTHLIPLCLASAFCAIGGPVNDTAFTDFVQAEFEVHELTKIFRLRTAAETGCALVAMVISPFLFRVSSVSSVITGIGILTLTLSIYGRLHIGLRVNLKPE